MPGKPKLTLAEIKANPPKFTSEQHTRLEAMSQDEIDAAAEADETGPEWSGEELDRAVLARRVREARASTGLTQVAFAERYHFTPSMLRDWEQGRFKPSVAVLAYLQVIAREPKAVERALKASTGVA